MFFVLLEGGKGAWGSSMSSRIGGGQEGARAHGPRAWESRALGQARALAWESQARPGGPAKSRAHDGPARESRAPWARDLSVTLVV